MTRHLPALLAELLLVGCGSAPVAAGGGAPRSDSPSERRPAHRVVVASATVPLAAEPTASEVAKPGEDAFGPIVLGMADVAVEKALGPAEQKTAPETEEGATGDWIWSWEYPRQGLNLTMAGASKTAPTTLRSITARAPCTLRTSRRIGIGSRADEARAVYGNAVNPEESDDERLVVGSVYGGIIFGVKDGKVTGIFYGAAAE